MIQHMLAWVVLIITGMALGYVLLAVHVKANVAVFGSHHPVIGALILFALLGMAAVIAVIGLLVWAVKVVTD